MLPGSKDRYIHRHIMMTQRFKEQNAVVGIMERTDAFIHHGACLKERSFLEYPWPWNWVFSLLPPHHQG